MTPTDQANGNRKWTDEQLKLAFHLYCQLPFGKIGSTNPSIIRLAKFIGRTPGAVAMKLCNFASFDPAIRDSGRKGLVNTTAADRRIWDEFHADWDSLTSECEEVLRKWNESPTIPDDDTSEDYTGLTRNASVEVRIGQDFFRKTILASYQTSCCMSGVSHRQLLVASHIVPWSADKKQRLNPQNGLCLSAIHDRAFDCGLITVTPDMSIRVSDELKSREADGEQTRYLIRLEGKKIELPHKFQPGEEFLVWHNQNIFRG